MNTRSLTGRAVSGVVPSIRTLEGGGFPVRRPFPSHQLEQVDPFLLLDEMGPYDAAPREAKGAPDHPHRGFETVTYLLSGRMEHRDSQGNHGVLGPGDVQWMTAGGGVVHSEMPEKTFFEKGGRMHGFQLWVNLPRRDKMMPPRYQDTPAARIPLLRSEDGRATVRVIAGQAFGQDAVIETRIPILYLHFTVAHGQPAEGTVVAGVHENGLVGPVSVPQRHNGFAYVVQGEGMFGRDGTPAREGDLVLLGDGGDEFWFQKKPDSKDPLQVLLIAAEPIGSSVARYGPFVMNTREEIVQAMEDYRNGRLGRIG